MVAYRAACDLGADMIEADVRVTRDGVQILMHDPDIGRTTSGTGAVRDVAWEQLRTFDAGSWFDPRFSDQHVPRLADLFDLAVERNVALCLEAKGERPGEVSANALLAAQEIARRGRLDLDVVASFDHLALRKAAEAVTGLRTAPDRLPARGPSTARALIAQARSIEARIIQHHFEDLANAVAEEVQAAGIEVWVWPTLTEDEASRAIQTGAVGIMGDNVANIVRALSRAVLPTCSAAQCDSGGAFDV